MTCIVPCLYNAYSFTQDNFDNESILCYSTIDRNTPSSCLPLLPKPMFIKNMDDIPESDSESSASSSSSSSSDSESSSSSASLASSTIQNKVTKFHPDEISQYAYNNIRIGDSSNIDSLLWCLYIMMYGVEKYEMIENHYTESNRFKFELIEILRENKTILKANKVKLNSVEDTLVHKPFITLETIHAVVLCKSFSLCIIQNRKYYDSDSGSGSNRVFIIEKVKGRYVLYIAPTNVIVDYLAYVRENYWRMESISAPIRPISAYKLQDLIDISVKLNLPTVNVFPGKFGSMGIEKRKTKPELYESICRCL